ncbi:MAG: efflux RND transporter periplasmic adaptor subunit [Pseudohaliea sp.]
MRITLFLLLCVAGVARAQDVPLAALGDLDLRYAPVEVIDRVPGAPLRGVVRARGGEDYRVLLPRTAHRATFVAVPGQRVAAGEPVVRLEGPEIHHWQLEFEAVTERHALAEARYARNRPLYEDGALPAERWAAIQDSFLELSLEYEHMRHFGELLLPDEDEDSLLVGAPISGMLHFDSREPARGEREVLFSVIPDDALHVQVEVPVDRAENLRDLAVGDCRLAIASIDRAADGFFVAAWSEALRGDCRWTPGTVLSINPRYATAALVIPRAALFQWQREAHVFVRDGEQLRARPVTVLGDTAGGYAVARDPALADSEVLVASVSAAQGILLGLGSE